MCSHLYIILDIWSEHSEKNSKRRWKWKKFIHETRKWVPWRDRRKKSTSRPMLDDDDGSEVEWTQNEPFCFFSLPSRAWASFWAIISLSLVYSQQQQFSLCIQCIFSSFYSFSFLLLLPPKNILSCCCCCWWCWVLERFSKL